MSFSPPSASASRRKSLWLVLLLGGVACLAGLIGCQGDEISHYRVSHADESDGPPDKRRLLGAIIPRGGDCWFFKLAGSLDAVSPCQEPFFKLVQSIRFNDGADKPISWTTPEGWKEGNNKPGRYATLTDDHGLELTITKLPASDIRDNVNRWRNLELGLGPVGPIALQQLVQEVKVDGGNAVATVVNMTGPGAGKHAVAGGMMGGPRLAPPKARPDGPARITYTTPNGWTDTGPAGGFTLASFKIVEGGQSARVTVTPPGIAGSALANVNRWRKEVGLNELSEAEFSALTIPTLKVGGTPGQYFDLAGPGGDKPRMLVVMVERKSNQRWYFKMLGAADLVGRQKANFESFVQSVKFTGAADE
jgi:hypothetical protein